MSKKASRTIRNPQDAAKLNLWIGNIETFPYTVTVEKGAEKRSVSQNRLQRQWLNDAMAQGDMSAEDYRAYCKLHFGVPILRAQDDEFRKKYDEIFRPLPYETKLELMKVPFDFPVTRLMTVKQKTEYLNQMYTHFTGLGILLTDPGMLGIADWKEAA